MPSDPEFAEALLCKCVDRIVWLIDRIFRRHGFVTSGAELLINKTLVFDSVMSAIKRSNRSQNSRLAYCRSEVLLWDLGYFSGS